MLFLLYSITVLLVALFVLLIIISPGKPGPVLDQNQQPIKGSISEKAFVTIGGVRQGMFIRSADENNPVLLYVTGGPSFSEYFLVDKYPTGLENHFTVCYWEERGGGISFTRQVTKESMTLEQFASDLIEVANYLRERFKKEKIYIVAHSGGTAFAIQAVYANPHLFHSYVGVSQITRQYESEKLAYKYMTREYASSGNKKKLAEFQNYPMLEDDSALMSFFNSVLRDVSMHELGIGTMHNMKSVIKGVFFPVWKCRAYTLREKFNIWYSKFSFVNKTDLRQQVIKLDVTRKVPKIDVPVYFISGKYDLTVNTDLAREYLNHLEAPLKGFYTFGNSAHSPMFEEPERFCEIIVKDVLNQTTSLADN